jgi:hypothetical protein
VDRDDAKSGVAADVIHAAGAPQLSELDLLPKLAGNENRRSQAFAPNGVVIITTGG